MSSIWRVFCFLILLLNQWHFSKQIIIENTLHSGFWIKVSIQNQQVVCKFPYFVLYFTRLQGQGKNMDRMMSAFSTRRQESMRLEWFGIERRRNKKKKRVEECRLVLSKNSGHEELKQMTWPPLPICPFHIGTYSTMQCTM